jgi:hypothetical protein
VNAKLYAPRSWSGALQHGSLRRELILKIIVPG